MYAFLTWVIVKQTEVEWTQNPSIPDCTDEQKLKRGETIKEDDETIQANQRPIIDGTEPGKKKRKRNELRIEGLSGIDKQIQYDSQILNKSPDVISYGQTSPVNEIEFYNSPRLGSGAFGVVYEITHPKDHQRMAVKCTSCVKDRDEYIVAKNEFKAIEKIDGKNCPYIVKYYLAEMARKDNFSQSRIYMEYMDMSLAKFCENMHFRNGITMDERELLTRRIIHNIASALLCLEEVDLVHRDIKPDNILVNKNGAFKLVDMGLCTSRSELINNDSNFLVGTSCYTPPQAAKDPIHDDMWRLGFTLLEILTGTHPYPGPVDMRRTVQLLHDWKPTFPVGLSDEMKKLILRLLKKDASHRPNSFKDILNEEIIYQMNSKPSADELAVIHRILNT